MLRTALRSICQTQVKISTKGQGALDEKQFSELLNTVCIRITIIIEHRTSIHMFGDENVNQTRNRENFTPVDIGDDDYTLSDKKFALVMVIDVSVSMVNEIDSMTEAFNNFIEASKENYDVKNAVDIAIITFGTDVKNELNGFCDISNIPKMNFTCRGSTNMSEALKLANQMARDRTHIYRNNGIEAYKPWILLMTDGYPNSISDYEVIAKAIREREDAGKIRTFAVGMGTGYNKRLLQKLTDKCLSVDEWDFQQLFSWLGKSLATVSQSRPGEKGAICDMGEEFQDMYGKFFDTM